MHDGCEIAHSVHLSTAHTFSSLSECVTNHLSCRLRVFAYSCHFSQSIIHAILFCAEWKMEMNDCIQALFPSSGNFWRNNLWNAKTISFSRNWNFGGKKIQWTPDALTTNTFRKLKVGIKENWRNKNSHFHEKYDRANAKQGK